MVIAMIPVYAARSKDRDLATTPRIKMIWMERHDLTPSKVYFGPASEFADPTSRMPLPPFSHFEKDEQPQKHTPKCYATDDRGTKWTLKFTNQAHSDVASPRIAWALGFGVDETYFLPGGQIMGVTSATDRGMAGKYVNTDGTFPQARFKRHPEHHEKDANDHPVFWDEANNPGLPQYELSGLKVLDIMLCNWDAQPKNCEILKTKSTAGPIDWYIMSDWGKSLGAMHGFWDIEKYRRQPFITGVDDKFVTFSYHAALGSEQKDHSKIPISGVLWFRGVVDKLTDDEIRAAFNAGVATPELTAAYAAGDVDKADSLTTPEVNAFVEQIRRRIHELDTRVPPVQ